MTFRKTSEVVNKLDEILTRLSALERALASVRQLARRGPASSQGDGLVPPESLRLSQKLYGPFTRLEWRLLACLWNKDALETDAVLDHLYGHDHEQDEGALRSLVKRLKRKLRKKSFPGGVVFTKGYAALQLQGGRK